MYKTPTIFGKLLEKQVPFAAYHTDLPLLSLWGDQFDPWVQPLDDYFEACDQGTLANVVAISPAFAGDLRTDDHSQGDVRLGQRFIREVFDAFVQSKQWERGLFILTYDEWGGFFDHVKPPTLPDQRASADLENDFGLAGFRVPTILASPYARQNYVDHRVYDHTSTLRFVEWRFLGAPPEGAGRRQHLEPHPPRPPRQQRRAVPRRDPSRSGARVRPRTRSRSGPTAWPAPRTRSPPPRRSPRASTPTRSWSRRSSRRCSTASTAKVEHTPWFDVDLKGA